MQRDTTTGNLYATQRIMVTLSVGTPIIIISDKLSKREVVNDIFDYIEEERSKGRVKGTITEIKFLENSVIQLN